MTSSTNRTIQFVRTAAATAVATALTGLALVLVIRDLGAVGAGQVTFVVTAGALASIATGAGTGAALRLLSGNQGYGRWLPSYLTYSMTAAVVAAGIVALAGSGVLMRDGTAILVAGFYGSLAAISRQFSEMMVALGLTVGAAGGLAWAGLAQVAATAILQYRGSLDVTSALLCLSAGPGAQSLWYLGRLHLANGLALPGARVSDISELMRVGFPQLRMTIGVATAQRADRLILVPLAGLHAAGLYAVAATFAELTRIGTGAAAQVASYVVINHGWSDRVTRLVRIALLFQTLLAIVFATSAAFVIPWLFGAPFRDAVPIAMVLLVAELAMGVLVIESALLLGLRDLGTIGRVGVLLGIASVPTYALGAEMLGAVGAALAALILYGAAGAYLRHRRNSVVDDQGGLH